MSKEFPCGIFHHFQSSLVKSFQPMKALEQLSEVNFLVISGLGKNAGDRP
jgi:hypothetical protein